jgi:hypothetical protein
MFKICFLDFFLHYYWQVTQINFVLNLKFIKRAVVLIAQILGSVLVAALLQNESTVVTNLNSTKFTFEQTCGINNCPAYDLPISSSEPTKTSVYILLGVFLLITFLGFLTTVFFMDDINFEKNTNELENKGGIGIKMMKHLI